MSNDDDDDDDATTPATISVTPELIAQIEAAIAQARPGIQNDGGDIALVSVERDIVRVALSGACTHCHMAGHTLGGLRRQLVDATGLPLRVLPALDGH
jgi:NifU-like protein